MKFMAAICLLATSASIQAGYSGLVSLDGKNVQFKRDFAHGSVFIGHSGIGTKDGNNLQLTGGQAALHAASPPAPQPVSQLVLTRSVVGPSGIVSPAGNVQFTQEMVDNIVLVGPSGIVTKSGKKVQFNDLTHNITLVGDSGIVNKEIKDIQIWNGAQRWCTLVQRRPKRSLVGPSGMITADGTPI